MSGCVGVVQRDVGSWVFVFGIDFLLCRESEFMDSEC